MSFSISSSDAHRQYVVRLLVLVVVPVYVLFALGLWLQPLSGDLTRIGFYAERDFGWNQPQSWFKHPLGEFATYNSYYDVVVLGDSFSARGEWQSYLAAAAGWSVITLHRNKKSLDQLLMNPVFRGTPPRILILESVERDLPGVLRKAQAGLSEADPGAAQVAWSPVPRVAPARDVQDLTAMRERDKSLGEVKVGFVVGYLWRTFLGSTFGAADTETVKLELLREAPLSSAVRSELLVYRGDVRKRPWRLGKGTEDMVRRAQAIRANVEANGRTRFALMVAPDKLTAYADFLRDQRLRELSTLGQLADRIPDIMPRLDQPLIGAIGDGQQDVYLPDDTHWGSNGYRVAADSLLAFFSQPPPPLPTDAGRD